MPLFQNSVLNKYLKQQDKEAVAKAFKKFVKYFHNPNIQENIRSSKEEEYQGIFLTELFSNILGYTMKPNANYNLVAEYKNEKNSRKADGAILKDNQALGVIELKGTNTKDLEKVRQQAFDYKANQTGCVYVITSNFEKIRFYINNAVDFEEFDLFSLNQQGFELLYLCLAKENILSNIPLKIKESSVQEEEVITKKFYKDYSTFKRELFRDLVKLNMKNEVFRAEIEGTESDRATKNIKQTLFKKSQKLIDRFLFIFFAEDRGLLPPNSTVKILDQWNKLKELDEQVPLYNRYKKYFNYLDTGRKGTDKRSEIFAYNGGLFKPDSVLDSLLISDELLYNHTKGLQSYDFESQVDVNILGHIFENSLNEIESVNAEIEGTNFDKQKTKRKKDGVFYTPKYITKYIVDNTVGKLCEEKKVALGIVESEYHPKRKKETKKKWLAILEKYREWLLELTILDPACGSGAFLNQALDFLIKEHQYIDELQTKLLGGGFVFPNIETTVLENNIFGVDINEESVEIAKLSLWLRTAQPRRKLNDLSSNIKCGNSLIDSKSVAGDKAFKWEKEYPNVFKEKNKRAFHVTTATHDSRTSQRMIDYKVRERRDNGTRPKAEGIWLEADAELLIAETVANIVKEDELNVMAFNICGDHMHLLLVCEEEELSKIVGKIKGKTARVYNQNKGIDPLVSKAEAKSVSLWTQKFGRKVITDDRQLENTLAYIQNNREKHGLGVVKGLKPLVDRMCCSYTHAFRSEITGGFDVVIGNPPYVQLQKMKEVSEQIKKLDYKTYESTGDLYCLFYEKGNEVLKFNGVLGFITSNKWMRANYGKSLRKYLYENTSPYKLLDLGAGIFESAVVDSNIIMFSKTKTDDFSVPSIDISNEKNVNDFSMYESSFVDIVPLNDEVWTIVGKVGQTIKTKIEEKGITLVDWDIEIKYGIKTGLNDAFIIDESKKKELIIEDSKSIEILEPLVRGRDVNRYSIDYKNLYLINTHNGYKENSSISIENYPAIKKHLDQFEPQLSKRGDKGKTAYNLRNCAYIDDFRRDKIIWKEMSATTSFVLDKKGYFTNDTITFIVGEDLEYLLTLLNSKLFFICIQNTILEED